MTIQTSTRLHRRSLLASGAHLGAGALLAGAALPSLARQAGAQEATLDFPYLWTGPEGEALQQIIDAYNESQDAVAVNGVPNPDSQRQLAAMASSRGFDISDNFGNTVGSWASKGILVPLDDYIAGSEFDTADFVPEAIAQQTYESTLYALPIAVHTLLLLYNKDLLEEAGIGEPPQTTSEWADAIAALTKVDDAGNITQLGLNIDSETLLGLVWPFGGGWVDEQNQPTATDPGNVAALQFWVDNVMQKYGVDAVKRFQSGFGEYASPQNPFYTGKVAMTIDGEWQARFIQQYAPDLNWAAVPPPVPEDRSDLAGATDLATSMFFIPSNAQNKDAAWEFLTHLVSPDPMRDFTVALANLPARSSLLDDPAYEEIPGFSYWLESLRSPNLQSFPNLPWGAEYRSELISAVDEIINLNMTPEDGLARAQERALALAG